MYLFDYSDFKIIELKNNDTIIKKNGKIDKKKTLHSCCQLIAFTELFHL